MDAELSFKLPIADVFTEIEQALILPDAFNL